jgi:hypothetical protein
VSGLLHDRFQEAVHVGGFREYAARRPSLSDMWTLRMMRAAIKKAIEEFEITDPEKKKRLVAQRVK